jgi:serine protease Do
MSSSWSTTIRVIILSVVLGGGSGVLTAALTGSSLRDYATQLEAVSGPVRLEAERPRAQPPGVDEALAAVREAAFASVGEIHLAPNRFGAYESNDARATAVTVTSDGWLMTSASLSASEAASARVAIGHEVYDVIAVVEDTSTGMFFLKVDGSNLPVLAFGDAHVLEVGDALFLAPNHETLVVTALQSLPRTESIVTLAETPSRRLFLGAEVTATQTGSPVLNASGELVGMMEAQTPPTATSHAIPLFAMRPAIDSLLREGKIVRPRLGVTVMDLTRATGVSAERTRGFPRGALVQAVAPGSPAAAAGLRVNDVLLEVDGEVINGSNTLDELLLRRRPGDTVTLLLDRDGESQSIDVILGEL